ncbi:MULTISPECIES: hypothetical protein [unclassified Microbacterium]|uniref:hypothetical protein n=1 Tax=unclassified Microbacterium TaxID=2609290 RepID=UPI00301A9B1B
MAQTAAPKKRLTKAAALTLALGAGVAFVVGVLAAIDGQPWMAALLFLFLAAITVGLTFAVNTRR